MSVLSKSVSYFPSINEPKNGIVVNLLSILQSNKHQENILNLRASDGETQKRLKAQLPCFTVAGTFSNRSKNGLLKLSGLAPVDLDSAEDYDINHLLKELQKIDCIAYAGLSCRGKRLFCIVPLLYPDKYVQHYDRLIQSFRDIALPMGDECHKNISQPRFVSWNDDSTHFFNHDAKPYHLLPNQKIYFGPKQIIGQYNSNAAPRKIFDWCIEQIEKKIQFNMGNRHSYIVRLARNCNLKGLSESDTISGCTKFVQDDFKEIEIIKIVKHIFKTQATSHNTFPFN